MHTLMPPSRTGDGSPEKKARECRPSPVLPAALALLVFLAAAAGSVQAATITYISSTNGRANPATSVLVNKPAGVLVTHLMIAEVVINGGAAPTITSPAGWTLLQRTNTTNLSQAIYYKFATIAEPASYTWTFSSSQRAVAGIMAFRGVDIGSPINANAAQANASSRNVTAPSITTTVPNTMLLGFFAVSARTTFTAPGGMTERFDRQTGGTPVTACGDNAALAAAGATGTRVATAGVAGVNIGCLVALKPSTLDHFSVEASPGGGAIGTQTVNAAFNILITARDSSNAVITTYNGTVNITSTGTLSAGGGTTGTFTSGTLTRSVTFSNTGNFTITATDSAGTGITGTSNIFTVSPALASFRVEASGGGAIPTQATNGPFNIQITALDGIGNTLTTFTGTVNITSTGTLFAGGGTTTNFVNGVLNPWSVTISNAGTWTITATNTAGAQTGTSASFTVASPSDFDAFDTDVPAGSITGPIRTKVTATPYSLRLVALNAAKTAIDATFNKTVTVEVLGSTATAIPVDAVNCPVNNPDYTVLESHSATFVNGVVTVSFATTLNANNQNVWRSSRIRITSAGPTSIACSGDVFAIRPSSITVAVTDANWQTAGAGRTLNNTVAAGGVVHKAGQPFTIKATANPATATNYTTNFTATPTIKNLVCTLPAACTNGVLTPGAWSASGSLAVQTTTASYSEAGAFNLEQEDRNFGAVDAGDPPPGSLIGTSTLYIIPQAVIPIGVGRFVPDHFDAAANNTPVYKTFNATDAQCAPPVAPDPARSFTYIGQPFSYLTPPQTLITARNAAGATTANYSGTLWQISASGVTETYADATSTATLDPSLKGTPTVTANNDGTGIITGAAAGTFSYTRTPLVPQNTFNSAISLSVSAQDTSETGTAGNGTISTTTMAAFNGSGGTGIDFDSDDLFIYGQLMLDPTPGPKPTGPDIYPLTIPIWVEWFDDSVPGFFTNASDYCTPYSSADVALSSYTGNLNAGETVPGGGGKLIQGSYDPVNQPYLSAPGAANNGSVTVTYTAPLWLKYNNADPSVVATFTAIPNLVVLKTVTAYSDPVNGTTNPKAIPGATMTYNVKVTNTGLGPADSNSVSITDPIPVNTSLVVSGSPVIFTDGTPPSGLTFAFTNLADLTDDVQFSNDGGITYNYVPTPGSSGADSNVTHLRVIPRGKLNASDGTNNPNFTISFKVIIK